MPMRRPKIRIMRYSRLLAKTLREVPQDIKSPSHMLLLRGGFIRPLAQGLFSFPPLGLRVLRNIEGIIREEMEALGGQEMSVPFVNPLEIWKKSGRDLLVNDDMVRFRDRAGKELVIAPTHEEAAVEMVRSCLNSYRDLPVFVFQFQLKYRDEEKPRYGLMRTKEFVMKDGYSFHRSYSDLNNFFPKMFAAYMRIFNRCGIFVHAAEAGVGYMGGERAYEFLMPYEFGEDSVILCEACGYTANRHVASGAKEYASGSLRDIERLDTPNCAAIDALSKFLNRPKAEFAKSMMYRTPKGYALAVVRGDYEVSTEKLGRRLQAPVLGLATSEELERLGFVSGYLSPVGLDPSVPVVVDDVVANSPNLIYGGNEPGIHLANVNYGRDYESALLGDISLIKEENTCFHCGGKLKEIKAVELGNIFKLGDFYSRSMDLYFQEESGAKVYPHMGSYGIGLGRFLAAIVENHRDENGIKWPYAIAPYKVFLMAIGKAQTVKKVTEDIYGSLGDRVLYDDRPDSPGVKFKDADILGIPLRVVVSTQGLQDGVVELRERSTGLTLKIAKEKLLDVIIDYEKGKPPA